MALPNLTVPGSDTLVMLACPRCDQKETVKVSAMIRGAEYLCETCGLLIEFLGGTTRERFGTVRMANPTDSTEFDITVRPDGVWVFLDEAERSVLHVLDHDSDRSVAIIVGSMIEARRHRAILGRCQRNRKIEERLFQPSGPLGSFSAKIDLAYVNGLISEDAHRDLVILKDIRNLFAHNLAIKTFRSQRIKDKASNLGLVESHVADFVAGPDGTGQGATLRHGDKPVISVKHASKRKNRPRDRYLMTAQLFTVRFAPADLRDYPLPLI